MNTLRPLPLQPAPSPRRDRHGFSLVEVLAAMTVLAILVLMVTRIFNDSSATWKMGERRIDNNANGRAALEWMQRELGSAIVDDVLTLKIDTGKSVDYFTNSTDRISFVALNNKASTNKAESCRDVQQIQYELGKPPTNGYNLYRRVARNETDTTSGLTCYNDKDWFAKDGYAEELISTAARLRFWGYDTGGVYRANYDSRIHGPPAWVDVALCALSQDDVEQVEGLRTGGVAYNTIRDYFNNMNRLYVTRVYLQNTLGYQAR